MLLEKLNSGVTIFLVGWLQSREITNKKDKQTNHKKNVTKELYSTMGMQLMICLSENFGYIMPPGSYWKAKVSETSTPLYYLTVVIITQSCYE